MNSFVAIAYAKRVNTLGMNPWMPYADPDRSFVRYWYSASEGHKAPAFLKTLQDANQDRLEAEGGACIMYTHFGHGFEQHHSRIRITAGIDRCHSHWLMALRFQNQSLLETRFEKGRSDHLSCCIRLPPGSRPVKR